jgi:hypothetical protein
MLMRKYDDLMTMHAVNNHEAIARFNEVDYNNMDIDYDTKTVFLKMESDDSNTAVSVSQKDWDKIHIVFINVLTDIADNYAGTFLESYVEPTNETHPIPSFLFLSNLPRETMRLN